MLKRIAQLSSLVVACIFVTAIAFMYVAAAIDDIDNATNEQVPETSPVIEKAYMSLEEISELPVSSPILEIADVVSEVVVYEDDDVVDEETTVVEEEAPVEYVVQYGDCFWEIADMYYGDGAMYPVLMEANNKTSLHPGDVITICDLEDYNVEEIVAAAQESVAVSTSYKSAPATSTGSSDGTKPDWTTYKDSTPYDTTGMTYAGEFKITGYDPHCAHCCGKTNGITASGNQAVLGYSVGCNNLPLGTIVYIEGYGIFRVDDRGGSSRNLIDIACDSHDICYHMTGSANVYIVN